jgi:spermidine synthase
MSARFEELDYQVTPMGELILRRRFDPVLGQDVFEAILNDEHLMSTHFTVAETELGRLGLQPLTGDDWRVLVGGLGLGYTAAAVLEHSQVSSLVVIDAIAEVVSWHQKGLLPLSEHLTNDPRVSLRTGDFFALMATPEVTETFDAIIVDIDHTPHHHLHPSHAPFYTPAGLVAMTRHLNPGGAFSLWSDDPPDEAFVATLKEVFSHVDAVVVDFDNPLTGGQSSNTVYVAH